MTIMTRTPYLLEPACRYTRRGGPHDGERLCVRANQGRVTETIQDDMTRTPTDRSDKTTAYIYDGDGHTLTVTADLTGGKKVSGPFLAKEKGPDTFYASVSSLSLRLNTRMRKIPLAVIVAGHANAVL